MTIASVDGDEAVCVWFDTNHHVLQSKFPIHILEKVQTQVQLKSSIRANLGHYNTDLNDTKNNAPY